MKRFVYLLIVGASSMTLIACGGDGKPESPAKKFAREKRAELRIVHERLKKVVSDARSRDSLTSDGFHERPKLDLRLGRVVLKEPMGDTEVWQLGYFESKPRPIGILIGSNRNDLQSFQRWLEKPGSRPPSLKIMKKFLALKHVFLVRMKREVLPALATDKTKFVPGLVKAEALLYKLDGGEYLGGVRIAAKNEDSITVHGAAATSNSLDRLNWLKSDLGLRAKHAFGAKLTEHLPETTRGRAYTPAAAGASK